MYTTEEYAAKKAEAQSALTAFEKANNADVRLANAVTAAQSKLDDAINAYNACVRSDAYERLFSDPTVDPLVAALKTFNFSGLMSADIKWATDSDNKKTGRIEAATLKISKDTDDDKCKEVFTLATLESTYNKLHEHDETPVDLMHSPEWSARITEVRRVFVNAAKIYTGYQVSATKANNGPTADMLVTLPDGTTKDATELTDDERAGLCDATSVRGMMPVLQAMVDAVLYDTTGRDDGLNRYRVYTTDVRYMRDNVLTYNKKTHHTSEANLSTVAHLCFDVLARLVAGRAYVLDAANK